MESGVCSCKKKGAVSYIATVDSDLQERGRPKEEKKKSFLPIYVRTRALNTTRMDRPFDSL